MGRCSDEFMPLPYENFVLIKILTTLDGTTLGQTYAQLFPERVGRLIIDGVSNLDHSYNSFFDRESLTDTDRIFTGLIEECFKAGENCPLNSIKDISFSSAAGLKHYIDTFLENLEEEPIPVYVNASVYGSVTRRGVVANGIFPSLYAPLRWPSVVQILAELLSGNATLAFNSWSDNWIAQVLSDETNTFVTFNDNLKSGTAAPVSFISIGKGLWRGELGVSDSATKSS